MTKAVSNGEVCIIKAELLLCDTIKGKRYREPEGGRKIEVLREGERKRLFER